MLRGFLQLCILGLFVASFAIYKPSEFLSIAGTCFFFGVVFAATFLLGTGAAEKLTERKIFLAFMAFAEITLVGGVLSGTGNILLALIVALCVWWGGVLLALAHPIIGHFKEEKEHFNLLRSNGGGFLAQLRKFSFVFLYAPIFVKKEIYFWSFLVVVLLYKLVEYLHQ